MENSYLKKVFDYNHINGEIRRRDTNEIAGYVDDKGSRVITHKGKTYRAHYLAWEIFYDKKSNKVYHINGNKEDNRIENLREFASDMDIEDVFDYEPETGNFYWKIATSYKISVGDKAGCLCKTNGYIQLMYNKKQYRAHRVAWKKFYGRYPMGEIDHINGDRSDNRIKNLRDVSHFENHRNMKVSKRNKTGVIGIRPTKSGKWQVAIKDKHVGTFADFNVAVQLRQIMEEIDGFHPNHGKR